jgi:exodeoxyribonuclease VII large subunit
MSENSYISVSELNVFIKSFIDSAPLKNIEVYGEISGFKTSGAHAYFVLKDQNSQLSAVCFNYSKTYVPKDGESVILRGGVDYYAKGGRLSFQVAEIRPLGMGLLAMQFELLKKKLEAEGLFSAEHKKKIPAYCKNILVVTSKTGAVIRDIVTTARKKNPVVDIVVKDVRVQGERAAAEIARALKAVDKLGYDVIVIARGGGSLEDLAPFYDEQLARTIFLLNTPVVSAVGHETDFSLCDFVADARAATPTAAAELVAYDYFALVSSIKKYSELISDRCRAKLRQKVMNVQILGGRLQNLSTKFYSKKQIRLLETNRKLAEAQKRLFERKLSRLLTLSAKSTEQMSQVFLKHENRARFLISNLDNLSPIKTLKRGYFTVKKDGKTITGVANLAVGDAVEAESSDGVFTSVVSGIEKKQTNDENN